MRRYMNLFGAAILTALLLAIGISPLPVGAQETQRPVVSAETLIETARAALAQGALEDAEFLLEGVKPGEGDIDDLDFLHGSIALHRGQWQAAIERFRAMLARKPELLRVRLDLGLAYFNAGEDGNAAYHFGQALGDPGRCPLSRVRGRLPFST